MTEQASPTNDLHRQIAEAVEEATASMEAIRQTLAAVARYAGWPAAHCYLADRTAEPAMWPSDVWYTSERGRFDRLRDATLTTRIRPGEGLPGRVFESGQPAWITDIQADPSFPRIQQFTEVGIVSAFAVPLTANRTLVGVLEFFSEHPIQPDPTLMNTARIVGLQLGRSIERERVETALQTTNAHLQAILDNAQDAIITADAQSRIESANPAAAAMFGYDPSELIGANLSILMPEGYRDAHHEGMARYVNTGRRRVIGKGAHQLEGLHRDGTVFPLQLTVSENSASDHRSFTGIIRDVSHIEQINQELRASQNELATRAYYDELTGLPNRDYLLEELERRLATDRPYPMCLLFIDVDNLKLINDAWGHDCGDELIQQVARRLQHNIRSTDLVARYGGDEFLLLMEFNRRQAVADGNRTLDTDLVDIGTAITKLQGILERPFTVGERSCSINTSIGASLYPDHSHSANQLIEMADTALFQAKASLGHSYCFYSEGLTTQRRRQMDVGDQIRSALAEDRLAVVYHPIVGAQTCELRSLEALVRLVGTDGALRPPGEFLEVAEQMGLIADIDRWVIGQVCRDLASNGTLSGLGQVNINLSSHLLGDPGVIDFITDTFRAHDVDTARATLELTEDSMKHLVQGPRPILLDLAQAGFRLAIDDFGKGYSSLTRLKELPVNDLKIDKDFVLTALEDPSNARIIEAVAKMASALDIRVTAEGVESRAHLDLISELGCACAQGFYFGRPVPPADLRGAGAHW